MSMTGLSVMRNLLGSLQEPLRKGLNNILGPLPHYDHSNIHVHQTSLDNFSVVGRE